MITNRLILIAENINTNGGSISKLLVSPEGKITAVVKNGSVSSSFADDWTVDYLNELCEKYTFSNTMQASRIIDVMSEKGYLDYNDRVDFENALSENIKSICVVLIDSPETDEPAILSRREFINRFADIGGYEPDDIFEIIADIEGINGITVQLIGGNLNFMFSPEANFSYTLFCMGTEQNRADFYMKPSLLKSIINMHNSDDAALASYITYFASFDTGNMSGCIDNENFNSCCFADIPAVINKIDEFVFTTSRFINNLYKGA